MPNFCKDCVHFASPGGCDHESAVRDVVDLVTGATQPVEFLAAHNRSSSAPDRCGPDGRYWEAAPPAEPEAPPPEPATPPQPASTGGDPAGVEEA